MDIWLTPGLDYSNSILVPIEQMAGPQVIDMMNNFSSQIHSNFIVIYRIICIRTRKHGCR